ncbi:MAG TPA: hypothetical protein VL285_25610 [Bryobacteraceae bacterium]|jgi:sucrose-6-phosphate hydrolase SacC (GH32 family)|nr:hypothetical protein [Bryobacteraceae bacterium]
MKRRELLLLAGNAAFGGGSGGGWIKSSRNPMLSLGKDGDFDSQNIMSPSIVKDGSQYYLFYAGGPLGPRNGGDLIKYQLGLALSSDGESWKKTGKPLLALGERDNFHVTPTLLRNPDGSLRKQNGRWHMVYCGNREDDVEYATSPNGIDWTKDNRSPIYRRAYAPNLVQAGSELRMYYIRKPDPQKAEKWPWEVHLATGRDLFSLRPHRANPMLKISQPWENGALFYPYVLQEDGVWVMFYASYWDKKDPADKTGYTAIGMAASPDGIRWSKHDANPILTPIPGSRYESVYNSSQSVIRDGDHYKMYYASRIDMIHKYYAICLARKTGKLL